MLGLLGMGESLLSYGVLPQNAMGDGPLGAILGNPDNRKAIGALLAEAKQQAVELLRANEPAIRALSERLLEKDEVAGEELEEIMVSKAVARATPAWRPVLELVGDSWPPALLGPHLATAHNGPTMPPPASLVAAPARPPSATRAPAGRRRRVRVVS